MRIVFQDQLARLDELGAHTCELAVEVITDASRAVLSADLVSAQMAAERAERFGALRAEAEQTALGLLAQQAPVATDLRVILSALWIVADAERMGALAAHIAAAAQRRHPEPVVPSDVEPVLVRMGELARQLGTQAVEVLAERDVDQARLLDGVDDEMDDLQRELFAALLDPGWPAGVQAAIDIALLGRFFERFADHAVMIAHRVIFLVTGENIDGALAP